MSVTEVRLAAQANGYCIIPCAGKRPLLPDWQNKVDATPVEIARWGGTNTGILCSTVPAIDIDFDNPIAAAIAEDALREMFDESGRILVRFGRRPRRVVPFRTSVPFAKMSASFQAPDGTVCKLEALGSGQQFIADGLHPDTAKPYSWHGGTPWDTPRAELPELTEELAQAYFGLLADRLEQGLGWVRIYTNGHGAEAGEVAEVGPIKVDVDARLTAMRFGAGLHQDQLSVTASMLRDGVGFEETVNTVFEATKAAVAGDPRAARWNWAKELNYIGRMCSDFILKNPELLDCLPSPLREAFENAMAEGREPVCVYRKDRGWWFASRRGCGPRTCKAPPAAPTPGTPAAPASPGVTAPGSLLGWMLYDANNIQPPSWIIKQLLPETGVMILPGQWGVYKTTTLLDLSHAIMTGTAFAGEYKVKCPGAVMMYALEGTRTVDMRLKAVALFAGTVGTDLPFYKRDACPALARPESAKEIIEGIRAVDAHSRATFGVPVRVLWIDTYSMAAGHGASGDDSDRAATQKIFNTLRKVAQETGILVAVVDHYGKLIEAGTTGSAGKEANADTVLANLGDREQNGTLSNLRMVIRKQRDGVSGIEIPFEPEVIELGVDEDGDPISAMALSFGKPRAAQAGRKPSANDILLTRAVTEAMRQSGFNFTHELGEDEVPAVFEQTLRDVFYEMHPRGEGDEQQYRQRKATNFERALKRAISWGRLVRRDSADGAIVFRTADIARD